MAAHRCEVPAQGITRNRGGMRALVGGALLGGLLACFSSTRVPFAFLSVADAVKPNAPQLMHARFNAPVHERARPNKKKRRKKQKASKAPRNRVAPRPLEPGTFESIGPLQIRADTRRIARAQHAELATVHRRPVGRAHANRELMEIDALSARIDSTRAVKSNQRDAPTHLQMPDLPIRWSAKTQDYLDFYTKNERGRITLQGWMQRLHRYEATMREILESHGVPGDLIYVAIVESGLNPVRESGAGAAGPWQFMPSSGASYGLAQDRWVDDRHHLIKSTHAAAVYLSDLHARFGNWELALAAYNGGYGLVLASMRRHNSNNYWTLRQIESGLPVSTGNYVPKVLAIAVAAQNLRRLGLEDPGGTRYKLKEIAAPPRVSLDAIAAALGEDEALLREFNAHWIRGIAPPERERSYIVLPERWISRFEEIRPNLRPSKKHAHLHRIRSGETLSHVAALTGTSEMDLVRENGLQNVGPLRSGDVIFVPHPLDTSAEPPILDEAPSSIAISQARDPSLVPLLFRATNSTSAAELETAFQTSWQDIVRNNDLDPTARLFSGQHLYFEKSPTDLPDRTETLYYDLRQSHLSVLPRGSTEHIDAELKQRGMLRRGYRVRRGDTLKKLARRFDTTPGSIARINRIRPNSAIQAGDILILYVSKSRSRGTQVAPPARSISTSPQ